MRDEQYIVNLCDLFLRLEAQRQYRFCFLRGDKAQRANGIITKVLEEKGVKLPVDAYYESLNLVIEFLEIQHFHPVSLFDNRMTCSNVSRGEQRKIYDKRRRIRLKENGIRLVEIPYTKFNHNQNSGRLIRNEDRDILIISKILKEFLTK